MDHRCPVTGFAYIDLDSEKTDASVMLIKLRAVTLKDTHEGVEQAIMARKIQRRSGDTSEVVYKKEVSQTGPYFLFCDCPHTPKDVNNA